MSIIVNANPYSPVTEEDDEVLFLAQLNRKIKDKTEKQKKKLEKQFKKKIEQAKKKRERQAKKDRVTIRKLKNNVLPVGNTLYQLRGRSNGSFTYRSTKDKKLQFDLVINNKWDFLAFVNVLYGNMPEKYIPSGFLKTNTLIKHIISTRGEIDSNFVLQFKPVFKKWLPSIRTKNNVEIVTNPKSKRDIKTTGRTFYSVFGKIKLKKGEVKDLHHFNVKPYEVHDYCVPSYCDKYLPKKKYKIIKDDLNIIKTPTYPELTTLLNKIDYGLNVYVINGQQIQKQDKKKNISILIHDQHMYILKKNIFTKYKGKVNKIDNNEFQKMLNHDKIEYFTNSEIIFNSKKYTLDNPYKDINKHYNFTNYFSNNNIKFYKQCNIRASLYCNEEVEQLGCMDIDNCYINIIKNDDLIIPIQNGTEITEEYDGNILDHGFYFCKFEECSEIENAIYGKSSWILGQVINENKFKVNITLQHIPKSYTYGKENEFDEHINRCFTGQLSRVRSETEKYYNTSCSLEKLGLLELMIDNGFNSSHGVTERYDRYKSKCGLYAYLGIISHSRNWVHKLYNAMNKHFKNIRIRRIYTDSIVINHDITEKDIKKINKITKKIFTSKKEPHLKKSTFDTSDNKNMVKKDNMKLNNYKRDDLLDMLKNNLSFCLTGNAGYGKSYSIHDVIIKYFKEHNIKYLITSTTIDNAEENKGTTLQSEIFDKNLSHHDLLSKFSEYKYLIIDECSQMSMKMFCTLQYIKDNTGLKIILVGDINQCRSVETDISYMNTYPFYNLVEHNMLTLDWIPGSRYSKEYDDFLNQILTVKQNKLMRIIKDYFKDQIFPQSCDDNNIFLVYTNDKGKEISKKKGLDKYTTVHKWQGKSIDTNHSIYEIQKMTKVRDVLYTALSRTKDPKYIKIIV